MMNPTTRRVGAISALLMAMTANAALLHEPDGWLAVINEAREHTLAIPRNGALHPRGQIVYVLTAEMEATDGSIYITLGNGPSWVLAFTGGNLLTAVAGDYVEDATGFQNGNAVIHARLYPNAAQDTFRVEVESSVNGVAQAKTYKIIPLAQADENGIDAVTIHLSGTARVRASLASRQTGTRFLIR